MRKDSDWLDAAELARVTLACKPAKRSGLSRVRVDGLSEMPRNAARFNGLGIQCLNQADPRSGLGLNELLAAIWRKRK